MSKVTIGICMGSSCFSRGNGLLSVSLREAIAEAGLTDRVSLKGFLCIDHCGEGPCVCIDDERCRGRDAHDIVERVKEKLEPRK